MPEFKPLPTFSNEYKIFQQYNPKIAKDTWAKANTGNTVTKNYDVFNGEKAYPVGPNDGFALRQPPLYYQKY